MKKLPPHIQGMINAFKRGKRWSAREGKEIEWDEAGYKSLKKSWKEGQKRYKKQFGRSMF